MPGQFELGDAGGERFSLALQLGRLGGKLSNGDLQARLLGTAKAGAGASFLDGPVALGVVAEQLLRLGSQAFDPLLAAGQVDALVAHGVLQSGLAGFEADLPLGRRGDVLLAGFNGLAKLHGALDGLDLL